MLFVHFRVSRSKLDDFKRKKKQGDRSRIALWRKFMPLPLLKGVFFFFLLPDVLAAQITHLEEQCSKKLWRVKTIDFKENYMQSKNGSNSSNSTSHSAEWIKGRRVHYIHHWHFEGGFFSKAAVKALMAPFFPQVHEKVSFKKKKGNKKINPSNHYNIVFVDQSGILLWETWKGTMKKGLQ